MMFKKTDDANVNDKYIVEHIKNSKGNPIATVVSKKINGKIYYGVSKCCKDDRFEKEIGTAIALGRLHVSSQRVDPLLTNVPHSIKRQFIRFIDRSIRYFKCASDCSFKNFY